MATTTTTMYRLIPAVFADHHARVAVARGSSDYFAGWWIRSLGDKMGNVILQEVAVCATGRTNATCKHGADSEDGELEAKPTKGKYNAHISDDTPRSLLRHHSIPFIILLRASEDGCQIAWALLTSYRVFDDARAAAMGATGTLPAMPADRFKILREMEKKRSKSLYKRSNKLPMECLAALTPGQYDIWINPELFGTTAPPREKKEFRIIRALSAAAGGLGLSAEFMAPAFALRDALKETS